MENVELPGGLIRDGKLCRKFCFLPVNGELELAIANANKAASSLPEAVTGLIHATVTDDSGQRLAPETISGMSVGDRQYLVYRLAGLIDDSPRWMSLPCDSCGEPFDISYQLSDVPVKKPGKGFPEKVVKAKGRNWKVRTPTGRDQSYLVSVQNPDSAEQELLRLLVTAPPGEDISDLERSEREAIEKAIESISPELAESTIAVCPGCGHENIALLDPWPLSAHSERELMVEVHNIAIHYHWSEREILSLPRIRRRYYLRLIDQARGMQHEQARES
jgi:hypothetical protein